MKTLLKALVISGAVLGGGAVQAASLSWDETGTGTLNQAFNPAPSAGLTYAGPGISLGQLLYTAGAGGARVTFTYLGEESGYQDGAKSSMGGLLDENDAIGTMVSMLVAGGTNAIVDFRFFDSANGFAINGGQWSAGNSIGLIGQNVQTSYGLFAFVLGYNDSGTGHDDWDDFVIGVNIEEVPEPASLALLGLGLAGLGLARRRRQ